MRIAFISALHVVAITTMNPAYAENSDVAAVAFIKKNGGSTCARNGGGGSGGSAGSSIERYVNYECNIGTNQYQLELKSVGKLKPNGDDNQRWQVSTFKKINR